MIYYFAYGSNLHPVRLAQRVPSAELIGVAEYSHHKLVFHKKGYDASGKCNMLHSGSGPDLIYGAIYQMRREHKDALDRHEGNGHGYADDLITVRHGSRQYTCFTYFARESHIVDGLKPYHWYKRLVLLGARYLRFPPFYISSIEAVESVEDPATERRQEKACLIEKINNYRARHGGQ